MKPSRVQIIGRVHYGDRHMHVDATYENAFVFDCMNSFRHAVDDLQEKIKRERVEEQDREEENVIREEDNVMREVEHDGVMHLLRSAHLLYLELSSKAEQMNEAEREWVERYKGGGIQAAIKADQVVNFPSCKSDFI